MLIKYVKESKQKKTHAQHRFNNIQPQSSCSFKIDSSKTQTEKASILQQNRGWIKLLQALRNCFAHAKQSYIYNYCYSSNSNCRDIAPDGKEKMTGKHSSRFKHKWIFDLNLPNMTTRKYGILLILIKGDIL